MSEIVETTIVDYNNGVGPVALVGHSQDRYTFRTILVRIVNQEKNGADPSADRKRAEDFLEYYRENGLTEIK